MNDTLALSQELMGLPRLPRPTIVAFPSKQSAQQLSGATVEAVKSVSAIMDQIIIGAIEKRTAADFRSARKQNYPVYSGVMLALGELAS